MGAFVFVGLMFVYLLVGCWDMERRQKRGDFDKRK